MSETKPKDYDLWSNNGHELIGKSRLTERYSEILGHVMTEMDGPLRLYQSFPTADAKVYLKGSGFTLASGAKRELPPLKNQIFNIPDSSVDFQTKATSGAGFVVSWPLTNTVGLFRRAGFTLISSGEIQIILSDEAASLSATGDAGALFTSGIPIGYIDLECTDVAGKWKTAGSGTNVIENTGIHRFGNAGGGGSGTGDASELKINYNILLSQSIYSLGTYVIFSVDGTNKNSVNTTASLNLIADPISLKFLTGEVFETVNLLDASFPDEVFQIDLQVDWKLSAIDTGATYEISKDGGTNWESLSLTRSDSSSSYFGTHFFTTAVTPSDLIVRITASADNVELNGIGLFYGPELSAGTEQLKYKSFAVSTDDHDVTLSLEGIFLPVEELLEIHVPELGQVFKPVNANASLPHVEGFNVVFPTDFFYDGLSNTLAVLLVQNKGQTIDMNDNNGALLSENHLGSSSPTLDKSVAGRGIFLRRPDGTMREICVDDNDNIVVYSV